MKKLKIKIMLDEGAYMPTKAHEADAGFDLRLPKIKGGWICVPARGSVTIATGVHTEIPNGYTIFLKSKSGLYVNKDITCEGVIDSEYTGPIVAKLCNHSSVDYYFKSGDKITQMVILPIPEVELEMVDSFKETNRGNGGFGSTGR